MDYTETETLALALMEKHGLIAKGWTFGFDRAKRRVGQANYAQKRITLSSLMVAHADKEYITQTLLHEIAHAMLPSRDAYGKVIGHGQRWKMQAAAIGYTGDRCAPEYLPADQRPVAKPRVYRAALEHGFVPNQRIKTMGNHKKFSGKLGVVVKPNPKYIIVLLDSGEKVSVPPQLLLSV
jgi:predicted SprT family Zn-dependent metalloprotease